MCYYITKHNMKCDARSVIWIESTPVVDPYGQPGVCRCASEDPTIKPRFQCEDGHTCCWTTKRWVPCDNDWCNSDMSVNIYVQHPAPEHPGLVWAFLPLLDGEHVNKMWSMAEGLKYRAPWTPPMMEEKLHVLSIYGASLYHIVQELKNMGHEQSWPEKGGLILRSEQLAAQIYQTRCELGDLAT